MRIEVGSGGLGYEVRGVGEPTVLLLHAFPLHRGMWAEQLDALAAASMRAVAIDLRGCGESDVGAGPLTMEQCADDARSLLDVLGIDRVAVVGLSLGGYVAFACLRSFPERISSLVLADTRATPDNDASRQARETTARLVEERGPVALFDRDSERLFGTWARREHPEIVARGRALAAENPAAGLAAAARGMGLRADSSGLLPLIECPTLVLVGEQDVITPVADARAMFERIPQSRLDVLSDAGHLSNMDQPAQFNARLVDFLRRQR